MHLLGDLNGSFEDGLLSDIFINVDFWIQRQVFPRHRLQSRCIRYSYNDRFRSLFIHHNAHILDCDIHLIRSRFPDLFHNRHAFLVQQGREVSRKDIPAGFCSEVHP